MSLFILPSLIILLRSAWSMKGGLYGIDSNNSDYWPKCWNAAEQLTFCATIIIETHHSIRELLELKGDLWLKASTLEKYQITLLDNPHIQLKQSTQFNLATFLLQLEQDIAHDWVQTISDVFSGYPDLIDLKDADRDLYTDGSSFICQGEQWADSPNWSFS